MDPRLLKYYHRELQHIREMGGEFAREFPKIAGRLGLDEFECADPYVERLLEGFAFMAARVQLKVDAEFPRFTQHLLDIVYPHYLAPTPSMTVVQFQPDLSEGALNEGFPIPRNTSLRSQIGKGEQTACEYRTAHDLTLWPLELVEAEYLAGAGAVANIGAPSLPGLKAGIRLRLRTTAGLKFNQIALDHLPLYLRGVGELPMRIYEQMLANAIGVVVQPTQRPVAWQQVIRHAGVRPLGFEDNQALLPYVSRSFQGYRLLQEYFAFPERFMFVELTQLQEAVRQCPDSELDIIILLNRSNPQLINSIDASRFALFCSPAINVFPKRTDRIHLTNQNAEYHVVPDRTRPLDYEVYQVTEVTGYGSTADDKQEFLPFYQASADASHKRKRAYYTLIRSPRVVSSKQRQYGPRSSYTGNEIYISLVDANEAPFKSDLRQLGLATLCTNRDLPLQLPIGVGTTDFTIQTGAPVQSIRCLSGPTRPRPSNAHKDTAWKLISHLSLNYLTIVDNNDKEGAMAFRNLLSLYGENSDAGFRKQIEGVLSIQSKSIVRRINTKGPIVFGRGLEVSVNVDEAAFEGSGVFLLGTVLERFFAQYVSINSFTEMVLKTSDRGEVMRWPTRIGQRHLI
ncbi:type VI secretion system baseplate subunit TssF [Methylobacter sp. BBA5.1]|uniref:type VI secretion system baseplate subunit TssF n=1 Tax=Methylobacter sp. BBA5.1 TaxID=1495064 RepID=UPI00056642A5|nr:type VI secretion system baseplate subunit TssF [Methylobacter sp. BBA5.1]